MKIVGYIFLAIPSALFVVGLVYGLLFMDSTVVGAYEGNLQVASNIFMVGAVFAALTIPVVIFLGREADADMKKRLITFGSALPIGLYVIVLALLFFLQQAQ